VVGLLITKNAVDARNCPRHRICCYPTTFTGSGGGVWRVRTARNSYKSGESEQVAKRQGRPVQATGSRVQSSDAVYAGQDVRSLPLWAIAEHNTCLVKVKRLGDAGICVLRATVRNDTQACHLLNAKPPASAINGTLTLEGTP